jgi:hypothetical protein
MKFYPVGMRVSLNCFGGAYEILNRADNEKTDEREVYTNGDGYSFLNHMLIYHKILANTSKCEVEAAKKKLEKGRKII